MAIFTTGLRSVVKLEGLNPSIDERAETGDVDILIGFVSFANGSIWSFNLNKTLSSDLQSIVVESIVTFYLS
jgi:hypothetical protein